MNQDIVNYNETLSVEDQSICERLSTEISKNLTNAESKIWHAHPVWFLNGNPIVDYSKQKAGVRLMFWSGIDFNEEKSFWLNCKFITLYISFQLYGKKLNNIYNLRI